MLKISGLFRSDHVNYDPLLPPSRKNPGGGVGTLVVNLLTALPSLEIVHDISQAESINITEPLWFSEKVENDSFESRMQRYEASKSFKILMVCDMEFARWQGHEREAIFDATDVIAGISEYTVNMLKAFEPGVTLLTAPVDTEHIKPRPKERQIFGMSNVSIEKNVDSVIDIFTAIPDEMELKKFYVGGADLWGLDLRGLDSKMLESKLSAVCDWRIPNATRQEVKDAVEPSWAYLADTGYDTFCYAMIEAMIAGCWLFCGKHLIYNERPCIRFENTADAVEKIGAKLESSPLEINEEARQYVIDHYSLSVFRKQLMTIIGGNYGL